MKCWKPLIRQTAMPSLFLREHRLWLRRKAKSFGRQAVWKRLGRLFKLEYSTSWTCGIIYPVGHPERNVPDFAELTGQRPQRLESWRFVLRRRKWQSIQPIVKRFSLSIIDELARWRHCLAAGNGGDLNLAKARSEEVKTMSASKCWRRKAWDSLDWVLADSADAKTSPRPQIHELAIARLTRSIAAKNGIAVTLVFFKQTSRCGKCLPSWWTPVPSSRTIIVWRFVFVMPQNEYGCENPVGQLCGRKSKSATNWFEALGDAVRTSFGLYLLLAIW